MQNFVSRMKIADKACAYIDKLCDNDSELYELKEGLIDVINASWNRSCNNYLRAQGIIYDETKPLVEELRDYFESNYAFLKCDRETTPEELEEMGEYKGLEIIVEMAFGGIRFRISSSYRNDDVELYMVYLHH